MVDSVVVDPRGGETSDDYIAPSNELVSYVIGHVKQWRDARDGTYKEKWDHFYNVWRGNWKPETKAKAKERSRLISPASMMAVDLTVAEIVEAIFGREFFFNVPDDIQDQQREDVERIRAQLHEDLYRNGVIRELTEVFLNGALYGTGIVKIMIDVVRKKYPVVRQDPNNEMALPEMVIATRERVDVFPIAVEPGQLVVDPAGTTIDDMLGVAHEFKMPLHKITKRQAEGIYLDCDVQPAAITDDSTYDREEGRDFVNTVQNWAFITEWHGLVPSRLLLEAVADEETAEAMRELDLDDDELVEAVVTIANESDLLRAIPNPCIMGSRAVLSYQHDTVPNQFWGRGVMEKAEHPQRAMDAEMRARIDHLAWISNPMIAGDLTRLPARMNMDSWPGKFWGTKGPPGEILQEFRFADVNASSFQHTQELERQVQQATGALDSIMSIRGNIRDETAAGSAISASGFIKRSKRTMYNIEGFMTEMIRRIVWRKMQFEPSKYPTDYDFQVKGAVGMMARELEQQQMINLIQYVPAESPPFFILLKGIMEASSSPASGAVARAVDQMMQPPSEEEQQKQQALKDAQMQMVFAELQNKQADTQLKQAQAANYGAQAQHTSVKAELEDDKQVLANLSTIIDQREVANQDRQMDIQERKLVLEDKKIDAMRSKPSSR